jgi:hypothetical protein
MLNAAGAILGASMTHVVHIIGAGLSKALQRPSFRIPLMQDFISVSADYMEKDPARVIFASIQLLETCGCFQWPQAAPGINASAAEISAYANVLRRRPAENIEALLAAPTGSQRMLATKVRYLINRLFVLLGWNVDEAVLRRFLAYQFQRSDTQHTVISFNYDLFLDRVVQELVATWNVATGYGITVSGFIHTDPEPGPPGPDVLPISARDADANVVIVKPHGSLNWLVPLAPKLPQGKTGLLFANYPPIIPLEQDGRLRYCKATSDFQYVHPATTLPVDVLPAIIPPVKTKANPLPLFSRLEDREQTAIESADEFFVIGWSMPASDQHQIDLIASAVSKRRIPPRDVTAVNRGEDPAYFSRVAAIFGLKPPSLHVYNDGFGDFVAATTPASDAPGCLPIGKLA